MLPIDTFFSIIWHLTGPKADHPDQMISLLKPGLSTDSSEKLRPRPDVSDDVPSKWIRIHHQPGSYSPWAFLAAVYTDLGRIDDANAAANEVMRIDFKFSAARIMQSHTPHDPERDARFRNLMKLAGLPGQQGKQGIT